MIHSHSLSRWLRLGALVAIVAVLAAASGCAKLSARDRLNKGVQAYKSARYEQAIEYFKEAVSLDPNLNTARLYLATAYAQQYIPGADTPENNQNGQMAIDTYKQVLERDPRNINSVKGIAFLYLNMKKFNESREYYKKAVELDPNDPEAYYSVAVIDWTESYKNAADMKAAEGLKVDDDVVVKNKQLCEALAAKNTQAVDDGIQMLQKALELRPDYDDAMAYLNLLYRRKADIQCGNPEERANLLKTADEWVDKTMAIKKQKAEKQQGPGGIVTEQPK